MYKLTPISRKFQHLFPNWRTQFLHDPCGRYSVWNFCLYDRYKGLKDLLNFEILHHPHVFPYIFWWVLFVALGAVFYSARELLRMIMNQNACVSTWRKRQYYVIPQSFLRKARIFGALTKIYSWLILIYGILMANPKCLNEWIALNTWMIIEIIMWCIDFYLGNSCINRYLLIKFGLPLINVIFVRALRNVFSDINAQNKLSTLGMWW